MPVTQPDILFVFRGQMVARKKPRIGLVWSALMIYERGNAAEWILLQSFYEDNMMPTLLRSLLSYA
jgi:hypothetical protein